MSRYRKHSKFYAPADKYCPKGKRAALSKIQGLVVGLAVMLTAHAAAAQSAPAPQPAIPNLPSYCRASTLNGIEFMRSIKAIITHGDLTDIVFIEKSFGTKFSSQHNETSDGSPDPQSFIYETDKVFGSPIHVDLGVWLSKSDQIETGEIAFMRIESPGFPNPEQYFIRDCFHISASDFGPYFGDNFFLTYPTAGAPVLNAAPKPNDVKESSASGGPLEFDAVQSQGSLAKHGSKIYLVFSYGSKDSRVFDVVLRQSP